jgi:asparaginyl-tRNA synthetase
MIEPEICFAGLEELFTLIEGYVKFCIDYCFKNVLDDMEYFADMYKRNLKEREKTGKAVEGFEDLEVYLKKILDTPFQKMSYTKAVEFLKEEIAAKKVTFENPVDWGLDLKSEHERYICEKLIKGPVFLFNYPKDIKAFYMKRNEDGKTV